MDQNHCVLNTWILDDSFFEGKPKNPPLTNINNDEESLILEKETDIEKVFSEISAIPDIPNISKDGKDLIKMIVEVLKDNCCPNSSVEKCRISLDVKMTRNVVRIDCADASLRIDFFFNNDNQLSLFGEQWKPCQMSIVGRIKPRNGHHHFKAGNLNNAIYNERMSGSYILILDNDMIPRKEMINYLLPWMYKRNDSSNEETTSYKYLEDEQIAWVQSPQYTINNKTGLPQTDPFVLHTQKAMDDMGLVNCNGTNMLKRLDAIKSIEGITYDSVSEDLYGTILFHRKGYRSVYIAKQLALGKDPENSSAFMLQQMRWCKGTFSILMLLLGLKKEQQIKFRSEEDRKSFLPKLGKWSEANEVKKKKILENDFYRRDFFLAFYF